MEKEKPAFIGIMFIIATFTGLLIFFIYLTKREAKKVKNEILRQSERTRRSFQISNIADNEAMYEILPQEYLTECEKNNSHEAPHNEDLNDILEHGNGNNERNYTSSSYFREIDHYDQPSNAELILRELFVPPSEDDDDDADEEKRPENSKKKLLDRRSSSRKSYNHTRKSSRKSYDFSYENRRHSKRHSGAFNRQSFSGHRDLRSSLDVTSHINREVSPLNPQLRGRRAAFDFSTQFSVVQDNADADDDSANNVDEVISVSDV